MADRFTPEQWARSNKDDRLWRAALALLLTRKGGADEAREIFETVSRRLHEPKDPWTQQALASVLLQAGRFADAEDVARQAVDGVRRHPEPVPEQQRVWFLDTLASALEGLRRADEAEAAWREGHALARALSRDELSNYAPIAIRFGRCLTGQHKFEEAEAVLLRTVESLTQPGSSRKDALDAAAATAAMYEAWGKRDRAAQYQPAESPAAPVPAGGG
jgi:tetratricopeptide (TPR) repeat protein